MRVWLLQPFFKCVTKNKNKKNLKSNKIKNQTAFQTPECNPKEDNMLLTLFSQNRVKGTSYQHHLKNKTERM